MSQRQYALRSLAKTFKTCFKITKEHTNHSFTKFERLCNYQKVYAKSQLTDWTQALVLLNNFSRALNEHWAVPWTYFDENTLNPVWSRVRRKHELNTLASTSSYSLNEILCEIISLIQLLWFCLLIFKILLRE